MSEPNAHRGERRRGQRGYEAALPKSPRGSGCARGPLCSPIPANEKEREGGGPIRLALPSPELVDALADAVARKVLIAIGVGSDRWMTSAEAAEYLAIPLSSLRKLTAAGAVPFSQDAPGGRCYFLRTELDRWRLEREGRGGEPERSYARRSNGEARKQRSRTRSRVRT